MNTLLNFIPEKYRPVVEALAALVAASQVVASQIVAQLPMSAANDPRWGKIVRALHWYGHARYHDEPGTVKLPGTPPAAAPAAVAAPVAATAPEPAAEAPAEAPAQPAAAADEDIPVEPAVVPASDDNDSA